MEEFIIAIDRYKEVYKYTFDAEGARAYMKGMPSTNLRLGVKTSIWRKTKIMRELSLREVIKLAQPSYRWDILKDRDHLALPNLEEPETIERIKKIIDKVAKGVERSWPHSLDESTWEERLYDNIVPRPYYLLSEVSQSIWEWEWTKLQEEVKKFSTYFASVAGDVKIFRELVGERTKKKENRLFNDGREKYNKSVQHFYYRIFRGESTPLNKEEEELFIALLANKIWPLRRNILGHFILVDEKLKKL
ncbi:MAG: hypothetical protein NUV82_01300 [Candidatus Komeilibacteria bacterium]|nr:hypothetical protein [Candidatus Komeilibacteria bacterium]